MKINYPLFTKGLALLLFAGNMNAQYFNPPNRAYATGNGPNGITVADFNGDGKKDIASANGTANNISVILGTGTGTFGVATNFAVGTTPYAVTSADFNGDGKADIAVCNGGSNNISVLMGNGLGSFTTTTNFAVGTGPRNLTSGDFNGDTKIDLAVANYGAGNVSILLGTGTGSFTPATIFAVGAAPRSIVSADFNGDTKADLATSNEGTNNISILIGTGTGSFTPVTNFPVGGTVPHSLAAADFNGDGKKDIATANGGSNNMSVLIGTGTGSFSAATIYPASTSPYWVTTADFNMDGKMDIALANYGQQSPAYYGIYVYNGTGTGTFAAAKGFGSTIWTVPSNASSLANADFNNDGRPDIAISNFAYNNVSALNSYIPLTGTCPQPMKIVMMGASGTFGFGASVFDSAFAYRFRRFILDTVNGFIDVVNLSHAGYTTYAIQPTGYGAPAAYPVDTTRNITKVLAMNPNGVVINFVTNDAGALFNLDTTKNNFLRVTNLLKAANIPFWITTTQPRNYTGDPPATITQKKNLGINMRDTIIKYYPTNYIEAYVGFAAANGDLLVAYDCGDNTHLNDAGHLKLFNNVKSKKIPNAICSVLMGVETSSFDGGELKLFPNPSNGMFTIESTEEISQIEVFDILGKQIYISTSKNTRSEIDLSNTPKGIYFVRLTNTNKAVSTKKIFVTD